MDQGLKSVRNIGSQADIFFVTSHALILLGMQHYFAPVAILFVINTHRPGIR